MIDFDLNDGSHSFIFNCSKTETVQEGNPCVCEVVFENVQLDQDATKSDLYWFYAEHMNSDDDLEVRAAINGLVQKNAAGEPSLTGIFAWDCNVDGELAEYSTHHFEDLVGRIEDDRILFEDKENGCSVVIV